MSLGKPTLPKILSYTHHCHINPHTSSKLKSCWNFNIVSGPNIFEPHKCGVTLQPN